MIIKSLRYRLLTTTTCVGFGLACAVPGIAQSVGPTGSITDATANANAAPSSTSETPGPSVVEGTRPSSANAPVEIEAIVVTGSRIAQKQLTSATPVTVVNEEALKLSGATRVEDALNALPGVLANQGGNTSDGATGTAAVDLRGLGPVRTLVLVNGRRLLPGDPFFPVADLNFIPVSLVKNVEVTTGGASSVYGADAVAGVVNFILDKDFEGFRIDSQYSFNQHDNNGDSDVRAALAARGFPVPSGGTVDGRTTDVNVAFGTKSADGQGHVTLYGGYRTSGAIKQGSRDFSACPIVNTGNPPGQNPYVCAGSNTTAPGQFIENDGSPRTFQPKDSIPFPINPATGQVFINPGTGSPYTVGDTVPLLNPDGTLNFQAGSPVPTPAFPARRRTPDASTGYTTFRSYHRATDSYDYTPAAYFQRPDTRYTLGGFANYEVTDYLKFYSELMFLDDQTHAVIAPSGVSFQPHVVNCDNPFLSASQVADLCTRYGYSGTQNAPVLIGRRNVEGGGRDTTLTHIDFRMVYGAEGDLGGGFRYDAYFQYGRSRLEEILLGDFSIQRTSNALQVVLNPQTGNPVCKSVLDGSDPNCVPYNVFRGIGLASNVLNGVTPGALNYLEVPAFQTGTSTERVVSASVTNNDLSRYGVRSPFAENGAGVSVGGEHRSENIATKVDTEWDTGDLAGQNGPIHPVAGGFNVSEGFGEVSIPVVEHRPFVDLMRIEAGYRYSSYDLSGTTNTYKFIGTYAPVHDVTFRGGYNRAVRAPNVIELFTPQIITGFNGADPCAGPAVGGLVNGYSLAQCARSGVTASQFGSIISNAINQYNQISGGNPALKPEKADSYTAGIVFTPRFIPHFSLAIDYFHIAVADTISVVGGDLALSQCVANGTPQLCSLVHRDPDTGSLFLNGNGYVSNLNENTGALTTSGVDMQAAYQLRLEDAGLRLPGGLSFDFSGTYLSELSTSPGVLASDGKTTKYDCAGYYGITCGAPRPKWRHTFRVTYNSPLDIETSLKWRYFGGVNVDALSQNPFLNSNGDATGPDRHLSAQQYLDLSLQYRLAKKYVFTFGVNNVLDSDPPLITAPNLNFPAGGNGSTYPNVYDTLGRYVFMGFSASF